MFEDRERLDDYRLVVDFGVGSNGELLDAFVVFEEQFQWCIWIPWVEEFGLIVDEVFHFDLAVLGPKMSKHGATRDISEAEVRILECLEIHEVDCSEDLRFECDLDVVEFVEFRLSLFVLAIAFGDDHTGVHSTLHNDWVRARMHRSDEGHVGAHGELLS